MVTLLTVRDIVFRIAVLFLLDWTFARALDAFDHSPDANIGAGLLSFLLLMAAAFGWGIVDGQSRGVPRLLLTWLPVAVLAAAAMVVQVNVTYSPLDGSVLLDDLRSLTPMLAGMVLVPALVGGGVSVLARRPARPATLPG